MKSHKYDGILIKICIISLVATSVFSISVWTGIGVRDNSRTVMDIRDNSLNVSPSAH